MPLKHVKRTEPESSWSSGQVRPTNVSAGVSVRRKGGLVLPYKQGLSQEPWAITKNQLRRPLRPVFRVASVVSRSALRGASFAYLQLRMAR